MTKYLMPILFGLLGVSILLYLGIWQIQRLQWKQEKLDKISAMMSGIPEDIPKEIDPIGTHCEHDPLEERGGRDRGATPQRLQQFPAQNTTSPCTFRWV